MDMENNKRSEIIRNNDDDDEMKMEKFYSLLRSFREARDRRRRELQDLENNQLSNKKIKVETAAASFEWQDFTTEIHFRKPPSIFPNPVPRDTNKVKDNNKGKKKEQLHKDLDLNLAL